MSDKVKVTIDGITVEVDAGMSILNAARQIGGEVVPPAMVGSPGTELEFAL